MNSSTFVLFTLVLSCYRATLGLNINMASPKSFNLPRWHRIEGSFPQYPENPLTSDLRMEMPLFTLDDGLLFPSSSMPMHIFAMKFRSMINDLYTDKDSDFKMFGIVCSDGKGGICEIGTGAEIIEREALPDGRQLINVVGRQRFKIVRILREEPYMVAEVEYGLDDRDVPSPDSIEDLPEDIQALEREVFQLLKDILALSNRMQVYSEEISLPDDVLLASPAKQPYLRKSIASLFSFAVCDLLDLAYNEKQVLLQSPYLKFRLQKLRGVLTASRDALLIKISEAREEENAFE